MTETDYNLLSAAFKEALESWRGDHHGGQRIGVQTAANRVCKALAGQDPMFDRNRFLEACGL